MKSIKGTKTEQNLLISFAGESQARNRYTYFSSQAKKEGFEQISAIFADTAENEKEHAKRFFKFLEGGEAVVNASFPAGIIGDTLHNLTEAAKGEHYEYSAMYPGFAKVAEEEGFTEAASAFKLISKAEMLHEKRYLKLAENVQKDMVFKRETTVKWKCRNCAYVFEGKEAPDECPACRHPKAYYEILAENY